MRCGPRWWSLGLGALLPALLTACGQAAAAPEAFDLREDLVYAKHAGELLRLDIALPKGPGEPLPGLVVIHGGGWVGGSRKLHVDLIQRLAARGYVAATVSYRFAPRHRWPAQLEDVQAAVRYLRENADTFRLDPDRIGAIGFSAGAHLAMLLGTVDAGEGVEKETEAKGTSAKVQAVVAWFGPTDLGAQDYPVASKKLIEGLIGPEGKLDVNGASPVTYASRGDAPTLIYHGTKDSIVPVSQATRMAEALTEAGVEGEVVLLVGAGHGWAGALLTRTAEDSFRWFDDHLQRP